MDIIENNDSLEIKERENVFIDKKNGGRAHFTLILGIIKGGGVLYKTSPSFVQHSLNALCLFWSFNFNQSVLLILDRIAL